uniref:MHD domain-containing protein n=1 Tax=Lotharella oceanica TaxID=641309 RepID=A0A7S2X6Y1_9EUKA|mmetsp:Transcript_13882/g.26483  ORF Transcript_13882/g.26483 Transcript_13882/m.26483 type:complete len:433 (+) Transcript_13882:48-1346(+)
MLSAVFLCQENGDRLLERHYRNDVERQAIRAFRHQIVATKSITKPIMRINGVTFLVTKVDSIYIVGTVSENVNPSLVFEFLFALAKLFKEYFEVTKLDKEVIRDHFVLIYELLDEVVDNGYPQLTSSTILSKFIQMGSANGKFDPEAADSKAKGKLTKAITGVQDWRPTGLVYQKNEVYIDVLEHVNLLMSTKGGVLRSDVSGSIIMKTCLSGMPTCKFGLNDKVRLERNQNHQRTTKGIVIDDITFHRCVRLGKFDQDRTISFTPPDGEFELMKYRVTSNISLPFKLIAIVNERGRNRVEYDIEIKPNFSEKLFATNVVVKIPTPENATAKQKHMKVKAGRAKYYPTHNAIVWKFKRFPGTVDGYRLQAEVNRLHSLEDKPWVRPPIILEFQVPMYCSSGLHVRFLQVLERYKPTKWVRYITQAGQYQIRI